MADEPARVNVFVSGRVQGVFFRASTLEQAQRLGLTGWVKNLPDGSVEIVAEGSKPSLQSLIDWAHQGPPDAQVDSVQVRWRPFQAEFETFRIDR